MTERRVKILDFGLARAQGDQAHLTQTGAIIGTPAYMAPEQAAGKVVDHRCDLFSLGCVLYRMCTGEMPFKGTDTISILSALALDDPPPPVSLNPAVPAELSDLVMQLLAKKAEERPESAKAVAEAIREIEAQTGERTARFGSRRTTDCTDGTDKNGWRLIGVIRAMRGLISFRTQAGWSGKKRPPLPWLVGMAGGLVAAALAGIVLFWPTPRGVVKIESDDPSVEIVFDKTGPTVKGADKEPITLGAGEHGVLIKRGDFGFEADKFVLKKGADDHAQGGIAPRQDSGQGGRPGHRGKRTAGGCGCGASPGGQLPTTFTNSLGMEFVLVPKGKSWLGGGGGKPGDKEVEIAHDFYLGKYEVTQEEWEKVTGIKPSQFSRTGDGKDAVKDIADAELKRFPVERVSWDDAQSFLELLNRREKEAGWVYRLPKEAEWEYACRGGPLSDKFESAYDFYFDKPTNQLLPEQANFDLGLKRTCKVGSYKPNRLGLYDMHGNVWEWCDDAKKLGDGASGRVRRGGSLDNGSWHCRAANRPASPPSWRCCDLGLRVARVPVDNEVAKVPPEEKKPADIVPSPAAVGPKPNVATTASSDKTNPKANNGNSSRLLTAGETAAKNAKNSGRSA